MKLEGRGQRKGGGGVFPEFPKFGLSPSVGYQPHKKIELPCLSPDPRRHIEKKKVSLIALRKILPKILPAFLVTQS